MSLVFQRFMKASRDCGISNPSAIKYALDNGKSEIKRRSDKKIFFIRELKLIFVFFIFLYKIEMLILEKCQPKKDDKITGKNIDLKKISLGNPENKNSGKFRYTITPVLYEEKPFQIVECGKMKIFSFNNKSFSVGLTIDKENEDYFKSIERRISDLYDDELVLIGHSKVYAKLFAIDGQILTTIRILSNGKNKIVNPCKYIGIPFLGKIVMRIAKIYSGSCLSLICEAKEVLIEKIQTPPSYFDEYPDAEDDE